jgi:hypothetical protein
VHTDGAVAFGDDAAITALLSLRRHMASKNAQSFAKRAREIAVKERRDRKRAKKAEAAARRAAGARVADNPATDETSSPGVTSSGDETSSPGVTSSGD